MQKILPAINGSEQSVYKVLIDLLNFILETNDIETVEEAMKIAEKEYKSRHGKVVTKSVRRLEENTPEWFNKEIEVKELSDAEQKAFEERLKNIK